jgi:hypothetical protein
MKPGMLHRGPPRHEWGRLEPSRRGHFKLTVDLTMGGYGLQRVVSGVLRTVCGLDPDAAKLRAATKLGG